MKGRLKKRVVRIYLDPRDERDPKEILEAVEQAMRPNCVEVHMKASGEDSESEQPALANEQLETRAAQDVGQALDQVAAPAEQPSCAESAERAQAVKDRVADVVAKKKKLSEQVGGLVKGGWSLTMYWIARGMADSLKPK